MKHRHIIFALSACYMMAAPIASAAEMPLKTAAFKTADGKDGGTASFTQTPSGVLIHLDLKNLTPGAHAMHVHQKGDCSPADTFKNAGDHLNPDQHSHGYYSTDGHHAGDMPNIMADAQGNASLDVLNDEIALDKSSDEAQLLDVDGSALIIHAKNDDYQSQPSGNAGDREACAALTP